MLDSALTHPERFRVGSIDLTTGRNLSQEVVVAAAYKAIPRVRLGTSVGGVGRMHGISRSMHTWYIYMNNETMTTQ